MRAQGPRWGRYHWGGRKSERVTVGLGYLYNLLQWLNWQRLTRWLMRKPWHVADELRAGGRWRRIYAYPTRPHARAIGHAVRQEEAKAYAERLEQPSSTVGAPKPTAKKPVLLGRIVLKPGMRLWQLVDGQVVEVALDRSGTRMVKQPNGQMQKMPRREAYVNPELPTVMALNEENAKRKLGLKP